MNKKCCNNNMNHYWHKDILHKKSQNTSENVTFLLLEGIEIEGQEEEE